LTVTRKPVVTKSMMRPLNVIMLFSVSNRQQMFDKNVLMCSDHNTNYNKAKLTRSLNVKVEPSSMVLRHFMDWLGFGIDLCLRLCSI